MGEQRKDDNLSYRVKLLRDLDNCPDIEGKDVEDAQSTDKPAETSSEVSESIMENVSSDPYLAELRSKYRPG